MITCDTLLIVFAMSSTYSIHASRIHDGSMKCNCPEPIKCPEVTCPVFECPKARVMPCPVPQKPDRGAKLIRILPRPSQRKITAALDEIMANPKRKTIRTEPLVVEAPRSTPIVREKERTNEFWADGEYPDEDELQMLDRLPVLKIDEEAHTYKEATIPEKKEELKADLRSNKTSEESEFRYTNLKNTTELDGNLTAASTTTLSTSTMNESPIEMEIKNVINEAKLADKLKDKLDSSSDSSNRTSSEDSEGSTENVTPLSSAQKIELNDEFSRLAAIIEKEIWKSDNTDSEKNLNKTSSSSETFSHSKKTTMHSTMSTSSPKTTTHRSKHSKRTIATTTHSSTTSKKVVLSGLDSIVADVSQPDDSSSYLKTEKKNVPLMSTGYKTNPRFALEEVSIEEKKCNDEDLLKILVECMQVDDSIGSKRSISATLSAAGQTGLSARHVSVLCSQQHLAFRLVARKYCQLTAGTTTCLLFML